jgi:hypothetical protein
MKTCMKYINAEKCTLSPEKVKDLMSLLQYLSVDNRKFYIEYLNQFNCESHDS